MSNKRDKQNFPPSMRPSDAQKKWLQRGLTQPGGKLPLFDHNGRKVSEKIVRACLENGWAKHWFRNPVKPDWLICRLTDHGRTLVGE